MQIIESSLTGVRSAVITLESTSAPMRFILFPMIHTGSSDFHQTVANRLRACDLIVAEGIKGQSMAAQALTLAYRLPSRRHRLALSLDQTNYAALGPAVIFPDMSAKQFRKSWRAFPVLLRVAAWCLVPLIALALGREPA